MFGFNPIFLLLPKRYNSEALLFSSSRYKYCNNLNIQLQYNRDFITKYHSRILYPDNMLEDLRKI